MTFTADMFLAMSWRDHRYNIAGRSDKQVLKQYKTSNLIRVAKNMYKYKNEHIVMYIGSTNAIHKMCEFTNEINNDIDYN
jgi:hypothetical protein